MEIFILINQSDIMNWMDILKRKWQGELAANRKESLERTPSIKIKIPEMSYPKEEKEIPEVLKVMKEKKLEPKEMKDADLKPDIEMFKIVGENRDDYEDFMLDVNHYAITEKMKYKRPRPFQVSNKIPTTKTTTDDTPAFPSGHSMLAHGLERVLGRKFPEKKKQLKQMADRISLSRIQMGSHYPSDIEAGKKIGYMLGDAYE